MKKMTIVLLFAFFLAMPFLNKRTGVSAQADTDSTVIVHAAAEDKSVTVGYVTVADGDGIIVTAENGHSAEVTTGDILANDTGVSASAEGENSSAEVSTGEIESSGGSLGIFADSYDSGTTAVTAESVQSEGIGVSARAYGEGSSTNVEITDTVESGWGSGIDASSSDGGTTAVTADSLQSKSTGVSASADGEGSSTNVEVSGSVESSGWSTGIIADSFDGGTTAVTAESVQSEGIGVSASADGEGSSTNVEVSGSVENNGWSFGIDASSSDGGTTAVTAESVQSEGNGVFAGAIGEGSSTNVEVSGSVESGKIWGSGIGAFSSDGGTTAVTADSVQSEGIGVFAGAGGEGSSTNVEVFGSVESSEWSDSGIDASSSDGGTTAVTAESVQSESTGVSASANGEGSSTTVKVNDEVSSEYTGIYAESYNGGTTEVTAGSVESESGGVSAYSRGDGSSVTINVAGNVNSNGEAVVTEHTYSDGSTSSNVNRYYGASINNYSGGTANLTVENVTSADIGINVYNNGENSNASVNAEDITANGETIITTNTNSNGEPATIYVSPTTGLMIVNDGNSSYNTETQEWVQNDAGTVNANIGNISSNHYGLGIRNYHNGSVSVTTGNITENGNAFAFEGNSINGQTPYSREYLQNKNTYLNLYRPVGFFINNYSGGNIDLTTGDIDSMSDGIFIYNADENSSANVKTDDIAANGETISHWHSSGAFVRNHDGAETDLVTGDITSTGDGITIYAFGEDSKVLAETGDIIANGELVVIPQKTNTYYDAAGNPYTKTSVANFPAYGSLLSNSSGYVELMTGEISSKTYGIRINNQDNGSVSVETDNITTNGETIVVPGTLTFFDPDGNPHPHTITYTYAPYGVYVTNGNRGTTEMTTGDITSTGNGIYADNYGEGSNVLLTADGDIHAGDGYGLYGTNSHGILEITILGNISSDSTGIRSDSNNGETSIFVTEDITTKEGYGISLNGSNESESTISIGGDVKTDGTAGIDISEFNSSQAKVTVGGDVRAASEDSTGLSVYARDNSTVDVLVAGTIAGDQVGVFLGETVFDAEEKRFEDVTSADNFKLTVWQIELNDEGHAAESANLHISDEDHQTHDREIVYGETEQEFEKSILYIIKVEQPSEGAVLRATDENGNALEKSHDYEVAHEEDTVLLKIDIQSGFELLGAYNGLGEKVPLLQDANGNFYVEVPKGGGVYLSAKIGKIHIEQQEDDDEESTPEPVYPAAYGTWTGGSLIGDADGQQELTITYELNGGLFNGDPVNLYFTGRTGQKHVMLEAPVREGYRFSHWIGAAYNRADTRWIEPDPETSYPYVPGSWFTIGSTDWTFIAVWDEVNNNL